MSGNHIFQVPILQGAGEARKKGRGEGGRGGNPIN